MVSSVLPKAQVCPTLTAAVYVGLGPPGTIKGGYICDRRDTILFFGYNVPKDALSW